MAMETTKKAAKKTLLVGIDLGTSRSAISADNDKKEWVEIVRRLWCCYKHMCALYCGRIEKQRLQGSTF